MKRVVLFFLFLCFLLVNRFSSVQAHAHSYTMQHISATPATKAPQVKSLSEQKAFTVAASTDISDDGTTLINDEDGDEEYITKSLLQAKFILALSFALLLTYCSNNYAERLPFCKHLSYLSAPIYIAHRALRI